MNIIIHGMDMPKRDTDIKIYTRNGGSYARIDDVGVYYEKGRWDMFQTITDAWFGKRCYFLQGEEVYSKISKKTITKERAYKEICLYISMREEEKE